MSSVPARSRHILHVIDSLDPATGGPTEAIRGLFAYAPPGYTGEVVTLNDPSSAFLAVYDFPVHALGRGRGPVGYQGDLHRWLTENRGRFDGVMVHGLWRYVSFAARRALQGTTPYVVFPHGMLDPYFKRQSPWKHLLKWAYWLAAEYWVLRDAYKVIFTTAEESRLARRSFALHGWNPLVVAIGADRPPADQEKLREAFLLVCPELRGKRFLLFLGRIHPKKGCDMLISAFIRLAMSDAELHLVMAGPDQEGWSAVLKRMASSAEIADRIHWPGMLTGDAKWGAFVASEAFILPSHQENFGIAVAEALACGRPVLLSERVNIAAEIAGDGAALVEPDTQEGTGRLVDSWIRLDEAARETMGQQALQTFNRRYDMQKNAAALLQVFDDAGTRGERAEREHGEAKLL